MGKIIREVDRGTRVVTGVDVRITELVWDNGARSFEVHRVDTGEDLTINECFVDMPTDDQIAILLEEHAEPPDWWICRGCGTRFDASSQGDLIAEHVLIFCDLVDGAGNLTSGPPSAAPTPIRAAGRIGPRSACRIVGHDVVDGPSPLRRLTAATVIRRHRYPHGLRYRIAPAPTT